MKKTDKNNMSAMLLYNQDCYKNIHDRTIVITIKIKDGYKTDIMDNKAEKIFKTINNVIKVSYLKILKTIAGNTSRDRRDVVSYLACGDVEGTRDNWGEFDDPQDPHIHAILILSKKEYEVRKNRMDELLFELRQSFTGIKEVRSSCDKRGSVFVRRYDRSKKPLERTISYFCKASEQANRRGISAFPCPRVFPFELDMDHGTEELIAQAVTQRDAVFNELQKPGMTLERYITETTD